MREDNEGRSGRRNVTKSYRSSGEVSKELIVQEIECGTGRNGSENKGKSANSAGTSGKNFDFSGNLEDTVLDLYSWDSNPSNGLVDRYQNDISISTNDFQVKNSSKSKEETSVSSQLRTTWVESNSKATVKSEKEKNQYDELKELDQQHKVGYKL